MREPAWAEFFAAVHAAALEAERTAGRILVPLQVAGARIDLAFSGTRLLVEMMPALRHLVTEAATAAEATFHVGDARTTGIRMPVPRSCDPLTHPDELWGFDGARFRATFHRIEGSVNVMDLETGEAVCWVERADSLPYWSTAMPLRSLFQWTLERAGGYLLHAAAIGDEHGAVLIAGHAGVGKSTTALTGLINGLRFAADDCLAVRPDPVPMAYSLFSTATMNARDVGKHPALAARVPDLRPARGERVVMRLHPAFESQMMRGTPLRAVLRPRIEAGPQTRFEPVDRQTLRQLAIFTPPSQLRRAGQATRACIEAMVDRLPGYDIVLGSDSARVAGAIRALLGGWDGTRHQTATDTRLPPVDAPGAGPRRRAAGAGLPVRQSPD